MLYIDQPDQTGFSYDTPMNGTLDLLTGDVTLLKDGDPIPQQDLSQTLVGTLPSQNPRNTANNSANAAQ